MSNSDEYDEDKCTTVPPRFHGSQFGIDWFEDEGMSCSPGPCVRLWSEDDGNWHLDMTFDATWLPELARVAHAAAMELPSVQRRKDVLAQAQKFLADNNLNDEACHLIRSLLLQLPGIP